MSMYLQHYGVKGMKWGVRRYQNPDGTLTAEGKRRYGTVENFKKQMALEKQKNIISKTGSSLGVFNNSPSTTDKKSIYAKAKNALEKRNLELYEKYKNKGMSDKEAIEAAKKRRRVEKAIVAAAAGGLVGAAVLRKRMKADKVVDRVLKKGYTIQRINAEGEPVYDAFYAAATGRDKRLYEAVFAPVGIKGDAGAKQVKRQMTLRRDIKIASDKAGTEALQRMYKYDREGIERVIKNTKVFGKKTPKSVFRKLENGVVDDEVYQYFNRAIVGQHTDATVNDFYKQLRNDGYSAVQDVNDKYFNAMGAERPLIIFDKDAFGDIKDIPINNSELDSVRLKGQVVVDKAIAAITNPVAVGTAGGGSAASIYDKRKEK